MSAALPLHEIQTLVWRLITAPEGVARGADALCEEGALPSADVGAFLRPSASLSATERLDVYADMYFYRLRDCLAEDFPNLVRRIGPERFHNLVTDFLLVHPSRHPSLRELGRPLPGFVAGHAVAARDPLAAPLAALEWARVDVFDEADAEPLSREVLLARAGAPSGCRLRLVPAARLLTLPAGVLPLWRALEDEAEPGAAEPGAPVSACVWRRGFAVLHRSLDRDEALCLAALARRPLDLGEVAERLIAAGEREVGAAAAGRRLVEILDRWIADGLLALAEPTHA
jgi:hypothetical protein